MTVAVEAYSNVANSSWIALTSNTLDNDPGVRRTDFFRSLVSARFLLHSIDIHLYSAHE